MKIAPRDAERFAREPGQDIRAVLVYGPDTGLVRERAESLMRAIVEDTSDPFRVVDIMAAQIKDDPARLYDEASALSLTGGRRVIRLRETGDNMAPELKYFLDKPLGDSLVVLEGGDLPARSKLRKLFESAGNAAALPCYRDDARSLTVLIDKTFADFGLTVDPEARRFLAGQLGGDRQLTRRELEKLALYKGPDSGPVTLEDARLCVGDSAALSLEDLALAVGTGNLAELERTLSRSLQEGAQPISILRGVARHFQRLHLVAGLIAEGTPSDQAMKQLRPPVFWKVTESFKGQVANWPTALLRRNLDRLLETEAACKRTGAPAETLTARILLEIAANAPRRKHPGQHRRAG